MTLRLPTIATTILSLLAGVLAVLNEATFQIGAQWHGAITVGLVLLAGLGIGPLVGPAFRSALHLSPQLGIAISAVLSALTVALTSLSIGTPLKAIIAGGLSFVSGLGFAPVAPTVVIPPVTTTASTLPPVPVKPAPAPDSPPPAAEPPKA